MTTNTPAPAAAAGALAAIGNLRNAIANVKSSVVIAGGDPILRLGRDGLWVYGADNVEPEDGSRWAINPLSLRHGIVCWKVIPAGSKEKPELYGKHMVAANQPKPQPVQAFDKNGDPVDHDKHPWMDVIGVDLKCMNGEDKGVQVIYEPSSKGGLRGMSDLMDEIAKAIETHPDRPVAVVHLKSDHYNHSTYGKTYTPLLEVVEWVSMDGHAPAPAEEKPAEEAPRGRRGAQAEPANDEPEQEVEEVQETVAASAPAEAQGGGERRRRRRAA